MSEIKKNIIKILTNEGITQDSIEEIIVKSPDNAIISIDFNILNKDKEEVEKLIKTCEEKLKKELKFEKLTIFLTSNAKNTQKPTKNITKKQEKPIFDKVKSFFNKKDEKKDKIKKNNTPKEQEKQTSQNNKQDVVGVKKIIAIASAKGGVGKSTFSVNLASTLKKIGHKVALVDADIYGPSIPSLLNLSQKPDVKDNLLIPLISNNMKIMSIGSLIDDDSAGVWRGPMITKILYQLIRSVNWKFDDNEVDYMIIDMPPGTGDVYLSLAQNFPLSGVVAISTPQTIAVKDVIRSLDCFNKLEIPILGLVQNMAFLEENNEKKYIFGQDNAKKMAQENKIRFLSDIPLDPEISQANEDGIPYVVKNPSTKTAFEYGRIAEEIIDLVK